MFLTADFTLSSQQRPSSWSMVKGLPSQPGDRMVNGLKRWCETVDFERPVSGLDVFSYLVVKETPPFHDFFAGLKHPFYPLNWAMTLQNWPISLKIIRLMSQVGMKIGNMFKHLSTQVCFWERSHLQLCVLLFLTLPLSDVLQLQRWREGSSINNNNNNDIDQLQNMHTVRCLQSPESIQNHGFFSRGLFRGYLNTLWTKMIFQDDVAPLPNPQSNWPIASDLTFPWRPAGVGTGGISDGFFRTTWLDGKWDPTY